MIENLLYPKEQSPQDLFVNPNAMFKETRNALAYNMKVPLINASPYSGYPPTIRFIQSDAYLFSIGLIFDLNKVPSLGNIGFIPLMFQDVSANIVEYGCFGWHTKTKDLRLPPDKEMTVPADGIEHAAGIFGHSYEDFQDGEEPLFVTKGTELDANGRLPTFLSPGAFSAVEYVVLPTFITSAMQGPFASMEKEFHTNNFTDGMLAIEIRIDISVNDHADSNQVSVSLWDPSMG